MRDQIRQLYERAIPEEMPAEVFADLAMRIIKQDREHARQEIDRLSRQLLTLQSLLNPIEA